MHKSTKKTVIFLLKKFHLEALFPRWSSLYTNCLFYIFTIYFKCIPFYCLGCGIYMHIPVQTGVQNGRISVQKNNLIFLKTLFLRLYFRDEGHLYAKSLFDNLTIFSKCHLFQSLVVAYECLFLSWREFKSDKSVAEKMLLICYKCSFWSWICRWKVTWMQIHSFIFSFFNVKPFFLVLKLWHTYIYSHPNKGSKWSHMSLKKCSYFDKKCAFEAEFPKWRWLGCQLLHFSSGYLS